MKSRLLEPAEYLPRVNEIYRGLSAQLRQALPYAEIEHIGSSAIEGSLSKGDLDVLVRVAQNRFEEAVATSQQLGFTEKLGTLRTPSLCMLVTDAYRWDVAIQVVARGTEFESFAVFRDWLNAHPKLVVEYNELKLAAEGLPDEEYRSRKRTFVERVLSEASSTGSRA